MLGPTKDPNWAPLENPIYICNLIDVIGRQRSSGIAVWSNNNLRRRTTRKQQHRGRYTCAWISVYFQLTHYPRPAFTDQNSPRGQIVRSLSIPYFLRANYENTQTFLRHRPYLLQRYLSLRVDCDLQLRSRGRHAEARALLPHPFSIIHCHKRSCLLLYDRVIFSETWGRLYRGKVCAFFRPSHRFHKENATIPMVMPFISHSHSSFRDIII